MTLHVEVTGNGPDIVLLHGWAMHGGVFAPLVERLRDRCTLHVVDLPGHGGSRDSTVPLRLADCAAAIAACAFDQGQQTGLECFQLASPVLDHAVAAFKSEHEAEVHQLDQVDVLVRRLNKLGQQLEKLFAPPGFVVQGNE